MMAKGKRLIDANALNEILADLEQRSRKKLLFLTAKQYGDVRKMVDAMKTVDAAPGVHGRWEMHNQIDSEFYCSVCKLNVSNFERRWLNYCPHCGAKMDGGADNGR